MKLDLKKQNDFIENIDMKKVFRTILKTSPEGFLFSDLKGNILFLSDVVLNIFGYNSLEEVIDHNIFDYMSDDYIEDAKENFNMLISEIDNTKKRFKEYSMIRKDGKQIVVELNGDVIKNEKNEIDFVYLTIRDVTKRKTEEELRESLAIIKNLNMTKDKLFAIIAHDLKGPIGNSALVMDLLLEDENISIEEHTEILENLRDSTKRIYNLLMNLLDWARSQKGDLVFSPEIVKLRIPINECMELLGSVAASKQITLKWDKKCQKLVYVDEQMLNTILRNLVSNAIKYTRKNGEIKISTIEYEQKIEISVEDNGVGIKPEKISTLFKASPSPSVEGTNGEMGTGIGLLLCKEFVEKNGGEIWAESVYESGTKFIFTVPKAKK